jgi:hypothetical protein
MPECHVQRTIIFKNGDLAQRSKALVFIARWCCRRSRRGFKPHSTWKCSPLKILIHVFHSMKLLPSLSCSGADPGSGERGGRRALHIEIHGKFQRFFHILKNFTVNLKDFFSNTGCVRRLRPLDPRQMLFLDGCYTGC